MKTKNIILHRITSYHSWTKHPCWIKEPLSTIPFTPSSHISFSSSAYLLLYEPNKINKEKIQEIQCRLQNYTQSPVLCLSLPHHCPMAYKDLSFYANNFTPQWNSLWSTIVNHKLPHWKSYEKKINIWSETSIFSLSMSSIHSNINRYPPRHRRYLPKSILSFQEWSSVYEQENSLSLIHSTYSNYTYQYCHMYMENISGHETKITVQYHDDKLCWNIWKNYSHPSLIQLFQWVALWFPNIPFFISSDSSSPMKIEKEWEQWKSYLSFDNTPFHNEMNSQCIFSSSDNKTWIYVIYPISSFLRRLNQSNEIQYTELFNWNVLSCSFNGPPKWYYQLPSSIRSSLFLHNKSSSTLDTPNTPVNRIPYGLLILPLFNPLELSSFVWKVEQMLYKLEQQGCLSQVILSVGCYGKNDPLYHWIKSYKDKVYTCLFYFYETPLFYKEELINRGIQWVLSYTRNVIYVTENYWNMAYLLWMDADVIVQRETNWINELQDEFVSNDIIQGFSMSYDLNPKETRLSFSSKNYSRQRYSRMYDDLYQPTKKSSSCYGYLWGCRLHCLQSLWNKTQPWGPLYPWNIVGSGDAIWYHMICGHTIKDIPIHTSNEHKKSISDYLMFYHTWGNNLKCGVSSLVISVLYHGSLENRHYSSRHRITRDHNYDPQQDINIYEQSSLRLMSWSSHVKETKKTLIDSCRRYFEQRKEDDMV